MSYSNRDFYHINIFNELLYKVQKHNECIECRHAEELKFTHDESFTRKNNVYEIESFPF